MVRVADLLSALFGRPPSHLGPVRSDLEAHVHWFASEVLVLRDGVDHTSLGTLPSQGSPRVHVNAFSLGLSNANEQQQVYSAMWDMPML